jgi:hypothetical protein
MPMAVARCRASANILLINDSVDGMTAAAPTPISALAPISSSAFGANAASTDATPNVMAPNTSTRRRPIRSPTVPMATSSPAIMNP